MYEQLPLFDSPERAPYVAAQVDPTLASPPGAAPAHNGTRVNDTDVEQLTRLVHGVVRRMKHMFAAFPDLSREDLIHEGLVAALHALPRFDATRSAISTFVSMVARRQLLDLLRQRRRRRARELVAGELQWLLRKGRVT
jgi:DNA-directed RNA polymerase specialized sigma24 family protein